jgi:hypothetical protein
MRINMNRRVRGGWESEAVIILLALVIVWMLLYFFTCGLKPVDPRVAHLQDKLEAVNRLNVERIGTQPLKPLAPPVDLIELNTPKWRAEAVKRTIVSSYDAEERHPLYWYTRLDGGLYAVEEVVVWTVHDYLPPETSSEALEKVSLREGMEMALSKRRDSLLNRHM